MLPIVRWSHVRPFVTDEFESFLIFAQGVPDAAQRMLRLGFLEIWMVPGFRYEGAKLDCSPRPAFTKFGKRESHGIFSKVVPCGREEFGTMLFTGQIRLASNSFLVPMANCATTFRLCPESTSDTLLSPSRRTLAFFSSISCGFLLGFYAFPSSPVSLCILFVSICFPASNVQKRSERNGRERTGGSSISMIDEYELQR